MRRSGAAIVLAFALLVAPPLAALSSTPAVPDPAAGPWWWPTQGPWMETRRLAPDDAGEPGGHGWPSHFNVNFGSRLALDGDTLAVGTLPSYLGDKPGFGDGGDWVYVFERGADGVWRQAAKLVSDDAHENDTFGFSIAVDDAAGVVVVGDPGLFEGTNKVYVFERDGQGGWGQTASFRRINAAGHWGGAFGWGVAASGRVIAASMVDGDLGRDPLTYIFEKVDGEWTETAALPWIGGRIDLEGDRLVGQFGERTACVDKPECTHAWLRIVDRVGDEWVPGPRIDPTAEHRRSQTLPGTLALSEDGQIVVIGSPVDCRVYGVHTQNSVEVATPLGPVDARTGCAGSVGSAWVYELIDGEWIQAADLPNPDPGRREYFGIAVDVSGDLVIVGANYDGQNGADPRTLGEGAGAVYVYRKLGPEWKFEAKLRNHDNGPSGGPDFFGETVAVGDSVVFVGAPWDDQRGDGMPFPFDDEANVHPLACVVLGCSGDGDGYHAGSVYMFEPGWSLG